MLEIIIKNSLDVVDRTERLIDAARRLLAAGLDEFEAYTLHVEIEKADGRRPCDGRGCPASPTDFRASARNCPLRHSEFDGSLTCHLFGWMTSIIPLRWELRQDGP
ncbi:hypothetical protein ACOJBM_35230 [Rhizobium beringeri]